VNPTVKQKSKAEANKKTAKQGNNIKKYGTSSAHSIQHIQIKFHQNSTLSS